VTTKEKTATRFSRRRAVARGRGQLPLCQNAPDMPDRSATLSRILLAAYLLLVAYGSLHPFSGWRDQGLSPLAFLSAPLPKYFTAFDLAANVAAYVPLGTLVVLALPRVPGVLAAALALVGGGALSLGLEALQSYLPDRIPSNVDLAANAFGALLGGLLGLAAARWLVPGRILHTLRTRTFRSGARHDLGVALLGLWVFSMLNPETLLFGNGDLRALVDAAPDKLYAAETFVRIEALVVGANTAAIALLAGLLVADGGPRRVVAAGVVVAALAARTLAFAVLFAPVAAFAWLTPGASIGLAAGVLAALALVALPPRWSAGAAIALVVAATVLVNLAPENPYLAQSLATWRQGHFLNFNGLTRLVSLVWPLVAVGYLAAQARRAPA
jgi:VanZ family protein